MEREHKLNPDEKEKIKYINKNKWKPYESILFWKECVFCKKGFKKVNMMKATRYIPGDIHSCGFYQTFYSCLICYKEENINNFNKIFPAWDR